MNYKRNPQKGVFISSVLSGITSVGLLYPATITPIRYAEGYGRDMKMIGKDMWNAEAIYRNGTQKEHTETSDK